MTQKLVLDTGQLDVDFVYATYGLILDDAIQGKLDESALNPQSSFNYANSSLGILNATAVASREVEATADTNLGAITATAQSSVDHFATASSELNLLIAQGVSKVIHFSQAQSSLGDLQASATSSVKQLPIAQANLQSLTASATATVTPVTPPSPPSGGGGIPNYRRKKPQFIDLIQEPLIVEKPVVNIFAASSVILGSFSAIAQSNIEWSILEDDAEILMLF